MLKLKGGLTGERVFIPAIGDSLTRGGRLAVALNRTRSPQPRPEVALKMDGMALELVCPPGYLADRPLTRADLETEARVFASLGYTLTWA